MGESEVDNNTAKCINYTKQQNEHFRKHSVDETSEVHRVPS